MPTRGTTHAAHPPTVESVEAVVHDREPAPAIAQPKRLDPLQILAIFITVLFATVPAGVTSIIKSALLEYKVEQLQEHQKTADLKIDTLVTGQAEGRGKLDNLKQSVDNQKQALDAQAQQQNSLRDDIQRLTAAIQARNNSKP